MRDLTPDPAGSGPVPAALPAGQTGDVGDLVRLYESSVPALYVWIQTRVRGSLRLSVDPEDLLQEVWLRALEGFGRYDPARSPFRAWLIGIAKNVLLETLRCASGALHARPQIDQSSLLGRIPDSVTTMTRAVARKDDVQHVLALIETLDGDDRALLLGHGLEGLTLTEVAVRLGISSEAATKRWQRLTMRLREPAVWSNLLGVG